MLNSGQNIYCTYRRRQSKMWYLQNPKCLGKAKNRNWLSKKKVVSANELEKKPSLQKKSFVFSQLGLFRPLKCGSIIIHDFFR